MSISSRAAMPAAGTRELPDYLAARSTYVNFSGFAAVYLVSVWFSGRAIAGNVARIRDVIQHVHNTQGKVAACLSLACWLASHWLDVLLRSSP